MKICQHRFGPYTMGVSKRLANSSAPKSVQVAAMSEEQSLDFPCVTIGVLTALPEEYAACRSVFDPDRSGVEKERRATSGTLTCWLCRVQAKHGGHHIVAITRLPQMGNTAAAICANILLQHCSSIHSLIMCGIAGAVPHPTKQEHHVRLGDIVVSNMHGIIQYDFGKQRDPRKGQNDPFMGFEFRNPPRPPCPRLLGAVGRIEADEKLLGRKDSRDWERRIEQFLAKVGDAQAWKRPRAGKDRLLDTVDGQGETIAHPRDNARRSSNPRVFHGPIGAANIVLSDPNKRDALRDRWGIKAVEMEGFGVADASWVANIGYLVVRGTCDYCNSTKNDDWHHYAALIAAAYARTVVEYLHPEPSTVPRSVAPATLPVMLEGSRQSPSKGAGLPSDQLSLPNSLQPGNLFPEQQGASPQPVRPQPVSTQSLQGSVEAQPVSGSPELSEWQAQAFVPDLIQSDKVRSLVDQIETLLKAGRFKECAPPSNELERLLKLLPRRGAHVREGWIMLARMENQTLQIAKQNNKQVDASRLRSLYQEAENVID